MRRLGDRRDGTLIRELDPMHYIMPLIFPNRCDNEAYMTMEIGLDGLEDFIRKYNEDREEDDKYSMFGVIISAMLRTIYERPKLNRFFAHNNLYQRNEITAAFVVKKELTDDSEETLARVEYAEGDTVDTIQKKVNEQIRMCKTMDDQTTKSMGIIQKIPGKGLVGVLARWADKRGLMPKSVVASDPFQCSIVLTNLGSIGMNIGYHHLMNWGTNSIFCVVGKKGYKPVHDRNGDFVMKRILEVSFTIDERISDGYYYGKSMRLFKKYVENPELMFNAVGK